MIDINNLKVILKANGVSLDLSDDELLVFVDYKVHELEGLLGFNVEETERNESHFIRKGNNLLLNFYPIVEVSEVKVNNKVLDEDSYIVDSNIGVIYFNSNICLKGFVEVSYSSGLPYFIVKSIITPLVTDMIIYSITNNSDGDISSIKEGDVSINYDNSTTLGNRINARITDLINRYSARLRML